MVEDRGEEGVLVPDSYDVRHLVAQIKYNHTEAGKASVRNYLKTPAGKEAHKRYEQSEKGVLAKKKYRISEKGRLAIERAKVKADEFKLIGERIKAGLCILCGGGEEIQVSGNFPLCKVHRNGKDV